MFNLNKKWLVPILFIIVSVFALTLTVLRLNSVNQLSSRAEKSTTLYFNPASGSTAPIYIRPGENVMLDIMLDPGTNVVSTAKVVLSYDPTKLTLSNSSSIAINTSSLPQLLEGPLLSSGKAVFTASIGSDSTKAISSITKIASVTFTAQQTPSNDQTLIAFDPASAIFSVAERDNPSDNTLANTIPAVLQIFTLTTLSPTIRLSPPTSPSITPPPTATIRPFITNIPTLRPSPSLTPIPSDTTSPLVNITYPLPGTIIQRNSSVSLAASARDSAGITRVGFRVRTKDYIFNCTADKRPYTCVWNVPAKPNVVYNITATAYDAAGNYAVSVSSAISSPGRP